MGSEVKIWGTFLFFATGLKSSVEAVSLAGTQMGIPPQQQNPSNQSLECNLGEGVLWKEREKSDISLGGGLNLASTAMFSPLIGEVLVATHANTSSLSN